MLTRQAVVLCGGKGTRLRPLTDALPKPLAPVAGHPFLYHLLLQLRENGFREVVLLTGYLGGMIADTFGDGTALGLRLRYMQGPEEWETASRLWHARELLQPHFLLLYGDNYCGFQVGRLEGAFQRHGRLGCLTVHPRERRANIAVAANGEVAVYDPERRVEGLNGVEIGYALFSREILKFFPEGNHSFSQVLQCLGQAGQLAAYLQPQVYYSISDLERLRVMDAYLTPKKILLLDRDGTVNRKAPRAQYVSSWSGFELIQKNVEGLRQLAEAGWSFVVLSNQAGVGRGLLTEAQVWDLDARMVACLAGRGIRILKSYYCFHHWEAHCLCRKPEPGLFLKASEEFLLPLEKTWYIGDDLRDCTAAWRAGARSVLVNPTEDILSLPVEERPQLQCADIRQFAAFFLSGQSQSSSDQ